MNKPLILVVEDDAPIRNLITTTLKTQDYKYIAAATASEALQQATIHAPDVMLLDLGLPDLDGIEVIRRIRSWSAMPIIVISARSEDSDKIEALDSGADDYLTKPFSVEELLARLRVLTRKKGSGSTNVYTLADLTVDTAARTAKRGGRTLELSAREYALLEYLIRSKGVVLSRQQIEDNLWSLDYAGGTNVVDVYISYLRKKLELPGERKLLHTVRGMGWVLKEDA